MKTLTSLTTSTPKFAATFISAVGLLICLAQYTWALDPSPVDLNIVAHQDDDMLFMNPEILYNVVAGHRQVTVYITAGNVAEDDQAYALEREEGAIAGYSKLLQLADLMRANPDYFNDFSDLFQGDSKNPAGCDSPTRHCFPCEQHACELSTAGDARGQRTTLRIPGSRPLNAATIGDGPDGPRVTLIFLRVQTPCEVTGNVNCPTRVDLAQLFTSGDPQLQIGSPFNQPGYTRGKLRDQLVKILKFAQADLVRTQDPADGHIVDNPGAEFIDNHGCPLPDDYDNPFQPQKPYDHSDHVWGARFAREALKRYDHTPGVKIPASYSIYNGYNLEWNEDPNNRVDLVGQPAKNFCLKKSIFYRYALHDGYVYQFPFDCFYYFYIGYLASSYRPLP